MTDSAAAPGFSKIPVLESWHETEQLHGIRLQLPSTLLDAHRAPGQVMKLQAPAGEGYFALANAPAADGRVELLVKRGGPVAEHLIARAISDGEVAATAPFGKGFPVDEARGRDLLLFAIGSGIAPVRALCQYVIDRRAEFGRAALFYGQRAHQDFAYTREHHQWQSHGLQVVLCASQADEHWSGARGYVQHVAHAQDFAGVPLDRAVAFLCGNKDMVSGVREVLDRAGLPSARTFLNF